MNDTSSNATEQNSSNNSKFDISQYSLDQKVIATLGTTKPNSKARENLLKGFVNTGKITSDEKNYLMGVS